MANISEALYDWSNTGSSNQPDSADSSTVQADLQAVQAAVRGWLAHKGSDIASGATTDLGAIEGLMHDITGTTTVTAFGTVSAGIWKIVKYEGAVPLTHNATSLILLGAANRTTANGDTQLLISEGSGNWREIAYFPVAINPIKHGVLATEQASTSGTAINFTSIPSWVRRITVMFVGVSTNGTDGIYVQIGDTDGIETTGYSGIAHQAAATSTPTSAFGATGTLAATTSALHGEVIITLEDASDNTWVAQGMVAELSAAVLHFCAGSKSLSATLDRVRITTVGGTNTFDGGVVNIFYE